MLTQRVGVPSMVSVHLKVTKKIRRLINNRDQPPLVGKERKYGWGSLNTRKAGKRVELTAWTQRRSDIT